MNAATFLMSLFDWRATNQSNCTITSRFLAKGVRLKCLELTASESFPPHPLPLLAHPLPTSLYYFAYPGRAPSLAYLFDLFAWKIKTKEMAAMEVISTVEFADTKATEGVYPLSYIDCPRS